MSLIEIMEPPVIEIIEPLFDCFLPLPVTKQSPFFYSRATSFFNVSGLSEAHVLKGPSIGVM